MPVIEKIGELQKQGLKEDQIAQKLREEGISPKEINEALDQSKVKSAVGSKEMEPSVMPAGNSDMFMSQIKQGSSQENPESLLPPPPGQEFPTASQSMIPPENAFSPQGFPPPPQEMMPDILRCLRLKK